MEDLERVMRAVELHVHDWLPADVAQHADEFARFLDRRERVERSVHDQRWRCRRGDVAHR
jgi:hypothetical protein